MRALVVALCVLGCGRSEKHEQLPGGQLSAPQANLMSTVAKGVVVTPRMPQPIGWWRGDDVCLQLFGNGDFELSIMTSGPKQQVIGTAKVTPGSDGKYKVALTTARIWRARYIGKCHRTNEDGKWIESADVLGATFAPAKTTELTLSAAGDTVELCGTTCVTLKRATPVLSGRWRRGELTYPSNPEKPWHAGDLLEINIDNVYDYMGHLWLGTGPDKFDTINGSGYSHYIEPDRFSIDLGPHHFTAVRMPGEKLYICDDHNKCTTLERQFDADHTTLD
jgi:hypothetical protein